MEDGKRTANWPIGATRIVQHRVKRPKTCSDYGLGRGSGVEPTRIEPEACYKYFKTKEEPGEEKLLTCLQSIYSPECNYMYSAENVQDDKKNDTENTYVEFGKKKRKCISKEDYALAVFKKTDKNGDGALSMDELKPDFSVATYTSTFLDSLNLD